MFPPRVVLAVVDFSEPSRVALTCAARLASHCGAELHVLHAEDPLLAGAAQAAGVDLAQETREELATFVASSGVTVQPPPVNHVVTGQAVDCIRDTALRVRADLIVIGMHGMSGAERKMFGSTTEGVLRKADTSVLVVPANWSPPRPEASDLAGVGPLVAAIDMSAHALAAAHAAAQLARALGTSMDAVHVVPVLPVPARWSAHAATAVQERMKTARAELDAALTNVGIAVPVRLRVETGHVIEQLAAAVKREPGTHPILVLGRRTGAARGGAPGSTAYRVLSIAEVPVLMHLPSDDRSASTA